MKVARKINAAFWLVAAVVLMLFIKGEWSKYGDYTILSFFLSLLIHGGICLLMGYLVDKQIVKRFNNCK